MPHLRDERKFLPRKNFLSPEEGFWRLEFRNYGKLFEWTHSHETYELVLVCSGTAQHVTAEGWHWIGRGDCLLITPGYFHSYEQIDHLLLANLLFDGNELAPYLTPFPPAGRAFFQPDKGYSTHLKLKEAQCFECEELLRSIRHEQLHREPGWVLLNLSAFLRICGIMARAATCPASTAAAGEDTVRRILRFFEENYRRKITLQELARMTTRSSATIDRLFRRELESSPMEYLLNLRLTKAAETLRNTDLPIGELAAAHGFSEGNYFSTRFSRKFGMSPRAWRRHSRTQMPNSMVFERQR